MYKILANTIFLGKDIHFLPECHSTNDIALDLVKNRQAVEGSIVATSHQTKGKGQRGNSWFSTKGDNLTFSIVLCPNFLDISEQFFLNMMISNAVRESLSEYLPEGNVKWPNDIIVPGEGKICGILIENVLSQEGWDFAVVGIGINVNQIKMLPQNGTSLKSITGFHFDLEELFKLIITQIEQRLIRLKKLELEKVSLSYNQYLYGYGKWRKFESQGLVFKGNIQGVAEGGKLRMKREDGEEILFDMKEVKFIM